MAQKMGRDAFLASYTLQVQEMAHDLKSQTGLMGSYVEQLKDCGLSDKQMHWLTELESQLDELMDGLPGLSTDIDRILRSVSLESIRDIVQMMIKNQPESRRPETRIVLHDNVELRANQILLKRAIHHLLRNSLNLKHHVNTIFVYSEHLESTSNEIRIVIADDGIGLPPEVEARVLRGPLWPVGDESYERPSMGLLYARNQVEAMGGTLTYQGKHQGRGAEFVITLNTF